MGQTIKVEVTFTDDADNQETLTSTATASVLARPNTPATGAPTIGGTAQVGEVLSASILDIRDADGLTNVFLWLPVGTERREFGHGHPGRHGIQLHPGFRRRGPDHQGEGDLHRRC